MQIAFVLLQSGIRKDNNTMGNNLANNKRILRFGNHNKLNSTHYRVNSTVTLAPIFNSAEQERQLAEYAKKNLSNKKRLSTEKA